MPGEADTDLSEALEPENRKLVVHLKGAVTNGYSNEDVNAFLNAARDQARQAAPRGDEGGGALIAFPITVALTGAVLPVGGAVVLGLFVAVGVCAIVESFYDQR